MGLLIFWAAVCVLCAGFVFTLLDSVWGAVSTLAVVMALGIVLYMFFPAEVQWVWNLAVTGFREGIGLVAEGIYFLRDLIQSR